MIGVNNIVRHGYVLSPSELQESLLDMEQKIW